MHKIIHDVETGEITEVELTAEEIAQIEADAAIDQAKETAFQQEEAAKAAAKFALLEKLGITADEAKLLLS